jgi:hypothetical protein
VIPLKTLERPLSDGDKGTAGSSKPTPEIDSTPTVDADRARYGPNTELVARFLSAIRELPAEEWEGVGFPGIRFSPYKTAAPEARALQVAGIHLRREAEAAKADAGKAAGETLQALIDVAAKGDAPIRTAMLRGFKDRVVATTQRVALALVVRELISSGDFIDLIQPLGRLVEVLPPDNPTGSAEVAQVSRPVIIYSRHARDRMAQRRVSEEEVEAVLTRGHTKYASREKTTVYIGRPGGRRIKVVIRQDSIPPYVITVGD